MLSRSPSNNESYSMVSQSELKEACLSFVNCAAQLKSRFQAAYAENIHYGTLDTGCISRIWNAIFSSEVQNIAFVSKLSRTYKHFVLTKYCLVKCSFKCPVV